MPSLHSDAFDVIPFDDIKDDWKKLGSGSFGNVYRGNYLGIDVAIKEVLPSTEYDVAKYFEREWRLMKECRHPNIATYMGLSRAPEPDNRIFIISEFIDSGNLRHYIHDKTKPFPWRLRISFATDITRALAYLHARRCIHRDLKGENLLVTSNGRLKITDFGFARIAARNADESKRLTFCGTDSYMSPEILLGEEFDLPTDIYSLGVIFCEIAARKLADDSTFKRTPPSFGIDVEEIKRKASPGCPPAFISVCIDCLADEPSKRPTTRDILARLREIESEVLLRTSEGEDEHVGSIKFATGGKRPTPAPRIPSFGMGIGKDIRLSGEDSDEELAEAVKKLSSVTIPDYNTWSHATSGHQPLLEGSSSQYSTSVIRGHSNHTQNGPPALSSIMTVRPSPNPGEPPVDPAGVTNSLMSIATMDSYRTAPNSSSFISSADATQSGSTIRSVNSVQLVHRFTLLKPGTKPKRLSVDVKQRPGSPTGRHDSWNPLDVFFSSGLLAAKCDVCTKRVGWKPVLECDDCGLRAHIKCGEIAPRDCGLRPTRLGAHQVAKHRDAATKSPPKSPPKALA